MNRYPGLRLSVGSMLAVFLGALISPPLWAQVVSLDPAKMPRIGTVDERFQSYNVEMVEVIGGRFWKPYSNGGIAPDRLQQSKQQSDSTPAGMDPSLYEYRSPIDLSRPRLRRLAAALGPAYVRVSGTWANSIYFQDSDEPGAPKPPPGFNGVLTRKEWKGVVDFSHAVNAEIVTSFATSAGTRDAKGVWTPRQASRFLAYTKSVGGRIAAAEFMNEPTYAAMGGAPKGYDAIAYGRDIAVFRPFIKETAPEIVFLGPGSVGEGPFAMAMSGGMLHTEDLLKAAGPSFDVFSYHLYAAASKRCASMGEGSQTTASAALSEAWLSRPEQIHAFYASLRDRFEAGKPIWITETADAACGGNPWAATFLDTFRYLVQHATLAQRRVQIIMHNTLAASDYGLLDESTLEPRPNYWATLLWRKLMGTTVLNPAISPSQSLHLYAHCLRAYPGGVVLLAINTHQSAPQSLQLSADGERYTLSARKLLDARIELNGSELKLGPDDAIPKLAGVQTPAGNQTFAPATITFLAIPKATNASCR